MCRALVLCLTAVLATQVALEAATSKKIGVSGTFGGGQQVSASCTLSSTGQVSGAGALYGKNNNGSTFSYAFAINKITTGKGTITLSGFFKIAGNPPISLTATVPDGFETFQYQINGQTVKFVGNGTVTIQ